MRQSAMLSRRQILVNLHAGRHIPRQSTALATGNAGGALQIHKMEGAFLGMSISRDLSGISQVGAQSFLASS